MGFKALMEEGSPFADYCLALCCPSLRMDASCSQAVSRRFGHVSQSSTSTARTMTQDAVEGTLEHGGIHPLIPG